MYKRRHQGQQDGTKSIKAMNNEKEPASEAKERIEALELENERLKQAYKYIHASRNSVDEELNEANKEITRLKTELERERELRKEVIEALSGMYLAEYGGNSKTIEEAIKRAPLSSDYEQRIISLIEKSKN